jgi:hypothetical protein
MDVDIQALIEKLEHTSKDVDHNTPRDYLLTAAEVKVILEALRALVYRNRAEP